MYSYDVERQAIFTDDGQRKFLKLRDRVRYLLKTSGAVRMLEALSEMSGDSFFQLACVERLVEIGELVELTNKNLVAGQYRVFIDNQYRGKQ